MPLSNKWNIANEIYKPLKIERELTKLIYRNEGFEAFVTKENEDCYYVEGNGVKCWIWKDKSKSRIFKVTEDYKLRYHTFSK